MVFDFVSTKATEREDSAGAACLCFTLMVCS